MFLLIALLSACPPVSHPQWSAWSTEKRTEHATSLLAGNHCSEGIAAYLSVICEIDSARSAEISLIYRVALLESAVLSHPACARPPEEERLRSVLFEARRLNAGLQPATRYERPVGRARSLLPDIELRLDRPDRPAPEPQPWWPWAAAGGATLILAALAGYQFNIALDLQEDLDRLDGATGEAECDGRSVKETCAAYIDGINQDRDDARNLGIGLAIAGGATLAIGTIFLVRWINDPADPGTVVILPTADGLHLGAAWSF